MDSNPPAAPAQPHLTRGFGLLHATALNMANMVGIGPFITIPLLMAAMGGPQSLLGWWVGALIVLCDGQVWSELGAALPGSGGSYRFLREAYGPEKWGRLMAFLFIWQFVLSGPLEIASGMIGFGQYATYLWPGLAGGGYRLVAVAVGILAVFMLARRITFLSRLTVTLWAGTVITMLAILAGGLPHFNAALAFDFPPGAFDFNRGFVLGLGTAALVAIYDYLGYYDICYIGDEVREPAKVIPRSILYSILACATGYFLLHLALLGVIPWREMLGSKFVVSEFIERLYGRGAAVALTLMILWTAFGSVFALLLGYSRIPYAAAVQGDFFRIFARVHPTKNFPHVSLYVLGAVAIVASFFTLDQVITALITTRVLVQFMGQIVALPLLRKRIGENALPYKMWLYPVPAIIAFLGWVYIFVTSGWGYAAVGVLTLAAGVGAFLVKAKMERAWPFAAAASLWLALGMPTGAFAKEPPLVVRHPWTLQSSANVAAKGDAISKPGYQPEGWYQIRVPNTVVGALVENGTYRDPYFGMNLRSIPGTTYPIGERFTLLPMPADSPFKPSWWYRTEFPVPAALAGRSFVLHFDGINYRANVWFNGERVAGSDEVAGAFRRYEFDVTRLVHPGGPNALAVEVIAPEPHDLAFMWVDWNPTPADKNMGLWDDVELTESGPMAIRNPHVVSRLPLPSLASADLTVTTEVWNVTDRPVSGVLRGRIEAIRFEKPVSLGPRERTTVRFTPAEVPALRITQPRLWWPYRYGPQDMYTLSLDAEAAGAASDRQDVRFGIQQMTSELTDKGHRLFKVNGRPILIRGGGWASDMLLRPASAERLDAQMRYVREMGLNTIRPEGKLETEEFYEAADRNGILVMPGWCCCDQWEMWDKWDAEDHRVAPASLRDQILRLRNHPSILAWLNGSDFPPPAPVEHRYLDVLAKCEWSKPVLSNATDAPGPVSGPSGVKMRGPYDYVPPSYWLTDIKHGGAFGFATEVGPGAAVPPIESLKRMLPADHLWPIDDVWRFHAGGDEFKDLKLFTDALEGRYGKATGVEDYARKAQALTYEGQRAMFEAYGRNKYTSTGVIQWMLNNAWPSMIWHLYDYFLRPGGGYYGTKKACEPVHVQYSYDDRSVAVVNDLQQEFKSLKVSAEVFNLDLASRFEKSAVVDVAADGVARAFALPAIPDLTTTYFLRLKLEDAAGRPVSSNFYWLSTREDELDWEKTQWYYTPTKRHADLKALAGLPPTRLTVASLVEPAGPNGTARVTVENIGTALAFQVRLKLTGGPGEEEILPVYWEDNYFALFPGEKRELRVSYPRGAAKTPMVEAEAWNAPRVTQ
jgi:exo-1,4-beta-D-glucosaminidase